MCVCIYIYIYTFMKISRGPLFRGPLIISLYVLI